MPRARIAALACAVIVAAGSSACSRADFPVRADPTFPAGSTMDYLHRAGRITVGIKFDQPGLGFRNPATGEFEGFDVQIARIVAAELGLAADRIEMVETTSGNREKYLQTGRVDIVIGSYSITAERRQQVGQAGPYYQTGQQLLVRKDDRDSIVHPGQLPASKLCTAENSTSIGTLRVKYRVLPVTYPTYTDCVRRLLLGSVDAVFTDGAVLLGYFAQQPDKLALVAGSFGEVQRYGIGYRKGDLAFCRFLTETIVTAAANGAWERAYDDTLGRSDRDPPAKPAPELCRP